MVMIINILILIGLSPKTFRRK